MQVHTVLSELIRGFEIDEQKGKLITGLKLTNRKAD